MESCYNMNSTNRRCYQNSMNYPCRQPMNQAQRNQSHEYYNRKNSCTNNRPCPDSMQQPAKPCVPLQKNYCHRQDAMEQLGEQFPPVMCYVPWQQWGDLYEPDCALCEGTLFKDLNLIFCGVRC